MHGLALNVDRVWQRSEHFVQMSQGPDTALTVKPEQHLWSVHQVCTGIDVCNNLVNTDITDIMHLV